MQQEYGEKKGEETFYASKNAGTITGVDSVDAAPAPDIETIPVNVTAAEVNRQNMQFWYQQIDDVTPGKP